MSSGGFWRRRAVVLMLAPLWLLTATGCIHTPAHCSRRPDAAAKKQALLHGNAAAGVPAQFRSILLAGDRRLFRVFIPTDRHRARQSNVQGPPVLLLHEMPVLSIGVLELAQRLADEGFTVYVPLLWGGEDDDQNSTLRGFGEALAFTFGRPEWKADSASSERPIVTEIASLARNITRRHPGQKLGLIGLCLTGIFPVALLGEPQEIPNLSGIVISQPSIPLVANTESRREASGLTPVRLDLARTRATRKKLEILGFRFEFDQVSPAARFLKLHEFFGDRFRDATVLASAYVTRDGCPKDAHAVLTDGYGSGEQNCRNSAGRRAYRQLVSYLKTALR